MADSELFAMAVPNWGRSVTLGIQFKTRVFKSRFGYETRSALKEFPGISLEYGVTGDEKNNPFGRQFFSNRLAEDLSFPDLFLKRKVTSSSPNKVYGDLDDHRYSTGRRVFLEGEVSGHHSGIVQSNDKTNMALSPDVSLTPGESVSIYPSLEGRIDGGLRSRQATSVVSGFNVAMKAHADQGRVKDLMGWVPNQWYRDRPVALWSPNWADPVTEDWSREQFGIDLGYGVPFYKAKRKHPERVSNHTILLRNSDEAVEVASFFCFCRGRQKSFYAPTWVDDFIFESPVVEGQTEILVLGQDCLDLYRRGGVFQSIAIRKKNDFHLSGILDFRKEGPNSVVVLSEPIPGIVSGTDRASWLLRQRFTSDEFEFEYATDSVSEAEVKMTSVLEDYPALRVSGTEIVVGGKFLTIGSEKEKASESETIQYNGFQISVNGDYLL